MKHIASTSLTLGALCIASLPAHAQSSVVLYGILDVGIEYANHIPSGKTASSALREESGNLAGSRWGLRGSEDLGGGYKALFVLESGFNLNNGALGQGGRLFGRKAYVGISTPYGTFTLGRHQNLIYELMYKYDAFTLNPSYSAQSMDSQFVNRADNSIRYGVTVSGLTFAALYSNGFDSTIAGGAQVPGASKVGREMSAALLYDRGPFSLGLTFDQLQGTSIATQSATQNRTLLGASYDLGFVKTLAGIRWLDTRNAEAPPSSVIYWGGLMFRISAPLLVSVAVYHTQFRHPHNGPTMGALLVDYALSKRTELYAEAAYVNNRSYSDVGIRGTGVDVTTGANQTGVTLGIRHAF
ncbi:porin [Burkholderia gladioli]|uniref:porin n=1 Tax=Burkholderia gladioli TaxID=28095 RepID=UPI00155FD45B|nr:porin [Burkholderia gladioli]NRF88362.1 porin [Burkholderia gladioli]